MANAQEKWAVQETQTFEESFQWPAIYEGRCFENRHQETEKTKFRESQMRHCTIIERSGNDGIRSW